MLALSTDENPQKKRTGLNHFSEEAPKIIPNKPIQTQTLSCPCNLVATGSLPSIPIDTGCVTGGHVMRLFHGHMDECLTISTTDQNEEERKWVLYVGCGCYIWVLYM